MSDTPPAVETQAPAQDARVAFTRRNWTGHFLRAEVNYGDYRRIMARIRRWDEWLPAWCETAQDYERLAAEAEARGARHSAAEGWRRAALCWHFGKFNWFVDPAKAAHAQRRMNACYERALWSLVPPGEKVMIPYGGVRMAAILRRPEGAARPPVVILFGGLDSVKEELQIVADYFLARGMATLAVDGPGQGETAHETAIDPESERPIGAAIDFLEAAGQVDASRVGLYGQSLGGYYAPRAAAFETRLKAAVADHWDSLPPMTREGYQLRTGARDAEDARARVARLSLAGVAGRVACPLLVLHGTADAVVPVAEGRRIAQEAPHATYREFEGGNHSLSNHHFEARTGMADWMAAQLGA